MSQYAITERTEGAGQTGPFLRMTLRNRAEEHKAVHWEVPDAVRQACQVGAVVELVEYEHREYKGEPQLVIRALRVVPEGEIRFEDLLPTSPNSWEDRKRHLWWLISNIQIEPLAEFLDRVFSDAVFERHYLTWPAAVQYHHAWIGGLADHSFEVASFVHRAASYYPSLNVDLLTVGALLHDVGKLSELSVGTTFGRTIHGELYGHVLLGIEWLRGTQDVTALPPALGDELEHMIASHHGLPEHGAIVPPKTPNAWALHLADTMSAKMAVVQQAVSGHQGPDPWTQWDKALQTRFYTGFLRSGGEQSGG